MTSLSTSGIRHPLHPKITFGTVLLGCALALPLRAETTPPSSIEERVGKLEAQLQNLQQENQQLRQQLGEVASQSVATAKQKWPEVRLNVLGSVEYAVNNAPDEPNSVTLGDVDLVTTARVNEQASATSDYVVASNHGGFVYEIERLFVSYKFNDAFNLDVGRFHTAMGWYNNFYHNGTYFQTTRDRPNLFLFEDNFGILPVHSTGLSLNGDIPSGSAGLSYSLEVSNGRNYTSNEHEALQIEDDNNFKAFNFQLRAKPEALAYWQFGAGAYHDTLTTALDPANAPDLTRIDQVIFSGFAVYKSPVVEWFTEGALVGDQPRDGHRHWTFSGYTQLSRKFGKLRPYVRLQWQDSAGGDPVLRLIGQDVSSWDAQVGLRYDFTSMMALKFEFDHSQPAGEASTDEFSNQLSFRF